MKKKLKPTKAYFGIYNDVFKYETLFSFGETDQQLISKLKRFIPAEELIIGWGSDSCQGYCRMFECGVLLVRMRNLPLTCEDYGILAHEIFHSVEISLARKGIEFNNNMINESLAYSIEHTTKNCYKKLNKYF